MYTYYMYAPRVFVYACNGPEGDGEGWLGGELDAAFGEVRSDPVRIKGLVRLCVTILHDVDDMRPVCGGVSAY